MAQATHKENLHLGKFDPSKGIVVLVIALMALGALGTALSIFTNPERGWSGYLTAFFYFSALAVSGMVFASFNNIAKAGWSASIRRLSESTSAFVPVILVGGLVLLAGTSHLYPWTNSEYTSTHPLVEAKLPYLNIPFMVVRMLLFALGMWGFKYLLVGSSIAQDKTGAEEITNKNVGRSIAFILYFALTFSFFSVDLIMSLSPTWYSTIFGVYTFSGAIQAALAFLILLLIYVRKAGFVSGYYTIDHIHDVAKYLKGFTVFWAYIAFSQFMLIWYANIPEETEFYLVRAQNGWTAISVLLIFGKFIVPFLALLPRSWKRNESHLVMVCIWVMLMQFVDVFWLVSPNFNDNQMTFGLAELAPFFGFLGLFLFMVGRFLKTNNLVAIKDPRLHEALDHHVTY